MKAISTYFDDGQWWIRIFGLGIVAKNIRKHPLLFSERNGMIKRLQIGRWSFRLLKKAK